MTTTLTGWDRYAATQATILRNADRSAKRLDKAEAELQAILDSDPDAPYDAELVSRLVANAGRRDRHRARHLRIMSADATPDALPSPEQSTAASILVERILSSASAADREIVVLTASETVSTAISASAMSMRRSRFRQRLVDAGLCP